MVGIVVVTHSQKLAEGVVETAKMLAAKANIVAAGGLPDGSLGTNFARIQAAVEEVASDDGVLILMDMGSAVMTAEMVQEDMDEENIVLVDCPLVEGAVVAALHASLGESLEAVKKVAEEARNTEKIAR